MAKENKGQRDEVTCPKAQSWSLSEFGVYPFLSNFRVYSPKVSVNHSAVSDSLQPHGL